MALKPLVMINDTIKKYEIKEKHKILRGNLYGKKKTTGRGKSFTINLGEITKYNGIGNKL